MNPTGPAAVPPERLLEMAQRHDARAELLGELLAMDTFGVLDLRRMLAQETHAGLAAHRLHQSAAAVPDRRGRWVRRVHGAGGPGLPGVAHIAALDVPSADRAATGMCGTRLRGELAMATLARDVDRQPPVDWSLCRQCIAVLAREARAS